MNGIIKIEDTEIQIREYNGQRVVTFKDIDTVHQRPNGTAKRNFQHNKKHFIDGEDYIIVNRDNQKDEIRTFGFSIPSRGITLVTESGYLMLAKSFTDDLSWEVQRQLVNGYFKVKEHDNLSLNNDIPKLPVYHTSDTAIPKNPSFYERNKRRMNQLCRVANAPLSFLYHNILKRVGEEYDLSAAEKIYEKERGCKPAYPMDMIDYFSDLATFAESYLDRIEKTTLK